MFIGQAFASCVFVALTVFQAAVADLHTPPHRPPPVDTIAVQKIALLPTSIPSNVPNHVAGRQILDSLIQAVLARSGFEIVPPDVVEPVWRRLADSAHGFYDPATGKLIADKLAAVSGAAARELGVWGILHPRVGVIPVKYQGGKRVEYDGVTEGVTPTRGEGVVGALTLIVVVFDSSGVPVQCGRGGIQLLAKGSIWNGSVVPVKPEKVFTDMARDVTAVERAFGGLLHHEPTCEP
jgi:hypothetical protein